MHYGYSLFLRGSSNYCNERNWTLPLGLFRTTFTLFSYWVKSDVSEGVSGCRYESSFDLTRPPDPHMGTTYPTLFRQLRGYFYVPLQPCNTEDAGDRAYGLESLSETT